MNEPTQLADRTLALIRTRPGKPYSLRSLSKRFKVDETEMSSAVRLIQDWDYRLRVTDREVVFLKAPDLLTATEIGLGLKTRTFGKTVYAYRSVKSTNDLAIKLAEAGAPEGTIVTAEEQTRGRGRLSRSWHSPPQTGVYVSIILRPTFPAERAPGLSIMAALALADSVAALCSKRVRIKWPNDVLISGRKLAGILTELSADRQHIEHVVLGIGINVNQRREDFPEALRDTATSLRRATRRKQSRVELLQGLLVRLEKEYGAYKKKGLGKSRTRLRRYSSLIGTRVTLARGREMVEGTAVDIAADGSLLVACNGETIAVSSGEVTAVGR